MPSDSRRCPAALANLTTTAVPQDTTADPLLSMRTFRLQMNRRACLTVFFGASLGVDVARAQRSAFVWRPPDITARIVRDDGVLQMGQYLRLRQSVRPGESGWTEMKFDLPESWTVRKVAIEGDSVVLVIDPGPTTFKLNRQNVSALFFRILDGDKHWTDAQLEQIWREIAVVKEPPR